MLNTGVLIARIDGLEGRPIEYDVAMILADCKKALSAPPLTLAEMVNRFLAWKLPTDFRPDAGISFKPNYNQHTPWPAKHEPVGTNLFTADQARAMFEHCLRAENTPKVGEPQMERCQDMDGKHGEVCWRLEGHSGEHLFGSTVAALISERCTVCDGAGEAIINPGSGDPWLDKAVNCPECGGSGRLPQDETKNAQAADV